MSGKPVAELVAGTGAEVVVEEVGGIRVVGAPAQQVEAGQLAGIGVVDEGARLLDVDGA